VSCQSRHPVTVVHGAASIEVWLVPLTATSATVLRAETLLSPEERKRARRGTPLVHMRRVLLRAALRELVGQRLGIHAVAVSLCSTPSGRPQLAGRHAERLDVSCSAGAGVGLVALAEGARVGVDVEPVISWSPAVLAEGWLSQAERAALAGTPLDERAFAATVSWTQKEAVLKGRGLGLPGGAASIPTPVGHREAMIAGWSVRPVAVPGGHVASLAVTDLAVEDPGA
jgi:4'-phosphopantetheinyl transferase